MDGDAETNGSRCRVEEWICDAIHRDEHEEAAGRGAMPMMTRKAGRDRENAKTQM